MDAGKLELIAKREMVYNDELYKLVDFLNKNLKNKQIIIGISKNDDKAIISIYETWNLHQCRSLNVYYNVYYFFGGDTLWGKEI